MAHEGTKRQQTMTADAAASDAQQTLHGILLPGSPETVPCACPSRRCRPVVGPTLEARLPVMCRCNCIRCCLPSTAKPSMSSLALLERQNCEARWVRYVSSRSRAAAPAMSPARASATALERAPNTHVATLSVASDIRRRRHSSVVTLQIEGRKDVSSSEGVEAYQQHLFKRIHPLPFRTCKGHRPA